MNETTEKIIEWIDTEPDLKMFLWDIAFGDEDEWGTDELDECIQDLLPPERGPISSVIIEECMVNTVRLESLYSELTDGRDSDTWRDEVNAETIRIHLVGE